MKCDLIQIEYMCTNWFDDSVFILDDVYLYVPIDGGYALLMVISFSVPTSSAKMVHLPPKKNTYSHPHPHTHQQ